MPRHTVKFFNAPLVLASLALVMPISAATAADIQQQMRELLTGTQTTHFVAQPGPREAKVATSAVDSQAFAKQLLPLYDKSADEAIRHGYLRSIGREPDADELKETTAFLAEQIKLYEADKKPNPKELALADFCQVLFGLNEFVYVE